MPIHRDDSSPSEVDIPAVAEAEDEEPLTIPKIITQHPSVANTHNSDRISSSPRTKHRNKRVNSIENKDSSPPFSKPQEHITNESLKKLQKMFEEADLDRGGGLDIDEFTKAMQKTMPGLDERELQLIFMKVDTNCDGTLDWNEYLSYMLLEFKEKDLMTSLMQDKPFPKPLRGIPSSHRDDIVSVGFIPTFNKIDYGVDYQHGRYVSVGKDGTMNFWSIDMHHLKTHMLEYARKSTVWITAMVTMPNCNMLAIASTGREISFFDITAQKFDRQYRLTGMDYCVLTMDFWFNNRKPNEAVLIWGDDAGGISALVFSECMNGTSLFGSGKKQSRNNENGRRIAFAELILGKVKGIQAYRLKRIHTDWVCRVCYFHTLDAFISCCTAAATCMYMGDLPQRKIGYHFVCRKGILCFDYDRISNIIVTGGIDNFVRIWNPYVPAKSIVVLKGHVSAVVQVIINSRREQIISIGKDNAIRVFNMADQSCVQFIPGHKITVGTHIISSVMFNAGTNNLVLASNQLAILEKADDRKGEKTSHNAPVCAALYSKLFGQIVSACAESIVSVWDVNTGEKVMQFTNAHFIIVDGEVIPVEITAMTFDPTGRRLITGARDGSLKIWNFNNGACLRELMTQGGLEIVGIVCPPQSIAATGWNRRVSIFMDAKRSVDKISTIWRVRHEEDIQAIAFNGSSNIATASYDGDIIIWDIENGRQLCKMNAYISSKPLTSYAQMRLRPKHRRRARGKIYPRLSGVPTRDVNSNQASSGAERKIKSAETVRDFKREISKGPASDTTVNSHRLQCASDWHCQADTWDTSVDKLLYLPVRGVDADTATILSGGADGWIRVWSEKGGLLGQFVAIQHPGASISAIVVNEKNEILISGDTMGYVKTWDISEYCISQEQLDRLIPTSERAERLDERRKPFRFPIFHKMFKILQKSSFNVKLYSKPPDASEPERTIKAPFLLNSYRAHLKEITHIEYLGDRGLIATSSVDCSVRMWTLAGRFIGTFGQSKPWNVQPENMVDARTLPITIPTDICREASATTMQVLKSSSKNQGSFVRNLLLATKFSHKINERLNEGDEDETRDESPAFDDSEPILGKYYVPRARHKMMPKLPPIKHRHHQRAKIRGHIRGGISVYWRVVLAFIQITFCVLLQVCVYASLPFSDLLPIRKNHEVDNILLRHRTFNPTTGERQENVPKARNVIKHQKVVRNFQSGSNKHKRRCSSKMSLGGLKTHTVRIQDLDVEQNGHDSESQSLLQHS